MKKSRGAILVAVLLLAVVFLVGGIALTTQQQTRYAAVAAEIDALQALTLAESGLVDALVKLQKDPEFPPRGNQEQFTFTYSETIFTNGQAVGDYTVSIDTSYIEPFEFFLVTVQATTTDSKVTQTLTAEIDVETRTVKMRTYDRV
jgi:Tfp pilus assembly protein PilX